MAKFQKGNPGGPGRPVGSRSAFHRRLDEIAREGAETMVRKMMEAGGEGDRVAARLVLSRIWSQPSRTVPIELPPIRTPDDLLAAHGAVAEAVSAQRITPQEASALASVFESHRRAFELVSQEVKVEALEDKVRKMRGDVKK
ncbi:MAG: hypothetical protein JSR24_07330 [Proteobacteria bacterium]|nr:hypothetical protein [Pseudomonadota bacterium]